MDETQIWLRIAKSNLSLGSSHKLLSDDVRYEELCFELQQCVEKSLKALLVYHGIEFPKIHIISDLLTLLQNNHIEIREDIFDAVNLTQYAVKARYPDDFRVLNENDYDEAVKIAERVYKWVSEQIA